MRTAEYRGKTVDGLHEIEVINLVDDRPGRVIAVPRSAILLPKP